MNQYIVILIHFSVSGFPSTWQECTSCISVLPYLFLNIINCFMMASHRPLYKFKNSFNHVYLFILLLYTFKFLNLIC